MGEQDRTGQGAYKRIRIKFKDTGTGKHELSKKI